MINLLPKDYADSIHYGRQNTILRYWLFGLSAAILGMMLIIIAGWLYINQQAKDLQANINTTNQQLKAQDLQKVQADAKTITGDIKVINKVLSSEVRFSDLIQAIGNGMPPGTVLGALSLTQTTGSIDLSASAVDYAAAAQIAVNLSDSKNNLFSKVDILNTNCSAINDLSIYKCSATFKALFSPAAKTNFLNVPKESK